MGAVSTALKKWVKRHLCIEVYIEPANTAPNRGVKKWSLPQPCSARTVGLMWMRSGERAPLAVALGDLI